MFTDFGGDHISVTIKDSDLWLKSYRDDAIMYLSYFVDDLWKQGLGQIVDLENFKDTCLLLITMTADVSLYKLSYFGRPWKMKSRSN